jgi:hypothetical protein
MTPASEASTARLTNGSARQSETRRTGRTQRAARVRASTTSMATRQDIPALMAIRSAGEGRGRKWRATPAIRAGHVVRPRLPQLRAPGPQHANAASPLLHYSSVGGGLSSGTTWSLRQYGRTGTASPLQCDWRPRCLSWRWTRRSALLLTAPYRHGTSPEGRFTTSRRRRPCASGLDQRLAAVAPRTLDPVRLEPKVRALFRPRPHARRPCPDRSWE